MSTLLRFTVEQLQKTYKEKIEPYTVKKGECLLYTGGKVSAGYGNVNIWDTTSKRFWSMTTHRVAYANHNNTIDLQDLCVLHKCDTPNCIAKEHLFLGTHKDNAVDRANKGRSARHVGVANGRAVISEKMALVIYTAKIGGTALASKLGISRNIIVKIKGKNNWSELTNLYDELLEELKVERPSYPQAYRG